MTYGKGICEGKDDNAPLKPTSDKELAIWKNKYKKDYVMIISPINEDMIHHINPITNYYDVLKKLEGVYDS